MINLAHGWKIHEDYRDVVTLSLLIDSTRLQAVWAAVSALNVR